MAHAQSSAGVKSAVRAGVRGVHLDDEAIGLMLERGTYLVPTLLSTGGLREAVEAGILADDIRRKAEDAVEAHGDSVSRASTAGSRWRWVPTPGVRRTGRTSGSCGCWSTTA
jgi:imidazolonepropionase-like amidohydrolase